MYTLFEIGIVNAVTAAAMAVVVLLISRCIRRPAVIHALWVLVLLKLVTPPIVRIPVGWQLRPLASIAESAQPASTHSAASDDMSSAPPLSPRGEASVQAADAPRTSIAERSADTERRKSAADSQLSAGGNEPAAPPASDPPQGAPPSRDDWQWAAALTPLALGTWIGGAVLWFVLQGVRIVRFEQFLALARPAPEDVQRQTRQLARAMGIRRPPGVWMASASFSPLLWALGARARLLFPAELLERVDAPSRATLLVHELAHYHRRDHWVRLLELVVTGLFWWHPAVWLARHQIETAEEQCCDAWVVGQFPGQPRRYAEALLDTIDFLSEGRPRTAPAASGLGDASFLQRRLKMIMNGVAPKSMSGSARLGLLTVAAVLLPLSPGVFHARIRAADAASGADAGRLADLPSERHANAVDEPASDTSVVDELADTARPFAGENPRSANELPGNEEALVATLDPDSLLPPPPAVRAWATASSPDQRFEVAALTDTTVALRDTRDGRETDLSQYQIQCVSYSPDGRLLATGGVDAVVHLFDCRTGESVGALRGHQAAIRSVSFSPDGRFVASASHDGAIKFFDVARETEIRTLANGLAAVNCIRFSSDGQLLAAACGSWMDEPNRGRVVVWDLESGEVTAALAAEAAVGALALTSDGQVVVSDWNGQVAVWDLASQSLVAEAQIDKDLASTAAFAPGSQHLLISAARQAILAGQGEATAEPQ